MQFLVENLVHLVGGLLYFLEVLVVLHMGKTSIKIIFHA